MQLTDNVRLGFGLWALGFGLRASGFGLRAINRITL